MAFELLNLETSREFPCPGCSGRVMIGRKVGGESLEGLHTDVPCAHFLSAQTVEAILGPDNYRKLGEPLEN